MFIVIASIVIATSLVYVFNRITRSRICPICAGVSLTWIWMLVAYFMGKDVDIVSLSILMGGSVVGAMYLLEQRLPEERRGLMFKTLFFLGGFSMVYSVLYSEWNYLSIALIYILLVVLWYVRPSLGNKDKVKELENKMENCCK